jgi:hypothetical protein
MSVIKFPSDPFFGTTLDRAQRLGWPAGVLIKTSDPRDYDGRETLQPAPGGGKATWLAWADATDNENEVASVSVALNWAVEQIERGEDPGPPDSWYEAWTFSP